LKAYLKRFKKRSNHLWSIPFLRLLIQGFGDDFLGPAYINQPFILCFSLAQKYKNDVYELELSRGSKTQKLVSQQKIYIFPIPGLSQQN
jgi:hypothetical protein